MRTGKNNLLFATDGLPCNMHYLFDTSRRHRTMNFQRIGELLRCGFRKLWFSKTASELAAK